jgi:hypothetical protein
LHETGFPGILRPEPQAAHAQKVVVVVEKFFQAGAGHVGQLDFRFLGGARRLAAFGDVLLARAGGLNHLVDDAVALAQKSLAKAVCDVVDNFSFLVGKQLAVVAVRR